jgi:transglutaminase-like putative cysteine protease
MDDTTASSGDGARQLKIVHRSRYEYAEAVTLQEHRLMFRPRDSHDLRLLHTSLRIEPQARIRWIHDPFGNSVAIARFYAPAHVLEIESTIVARQYGIDARDAPVDMHAQHLPVSYPHDEAPDVARYAERHYPDPDRSVDAWSRRFLRDKGPTDTMDLLVRMTEEIKSTFSYGVRMEDGTQPPAATLRQRSGTCRDFALLMMEARAASASRRGSSPATSTRRTATRVSACRASRPGRTPGCRSICPARAGWSSIPPTRCSAIAT